MDRVFNSLRQGSFDSIGNSGNLEDLRNLQRVIRNSSGYAAGKGTEYIIERAREYVIRERTLDPGFNFIESILNGGATSSGGRGLGNGISSLIGILGANAAIAGTAPPRRDPLTLDLDGDGIETTSSRDGTIILFDHDGDGIKTATGWIKPDDGWLVLDRNGNGSIDFGRLRTVSERTLVSSR